MADRTLRVEIVGDASSLQKTFGKAADSGDRLSSTFKSLGRVGVLAGAALGGAAVVGASKAINAASDLNESLNAVNVTFGESAKIVTDFGKNAAQRTGLSMRELNESVVPIGASLQNMGASADEAAKTSINLAKRAADMASVFNTDVGSALTAIQAGLRGEADPLERFGVGLSAARVEAFALSTGLIKTKKDLTDQIKVQARVGLLMKDSAKFAGDFANTSDGLANSQRILKAEIENAGAAIGTALLPVAGKVVGVLADMVPKAVEVGTAISQKVGPALTSFIDFIKQAIPTLVTFFTPLVQTIVKDVVPIFEALRAVATTAIQRIGDVIRSNGPQLRTIFENLGTVISNLAKIILPILEIAFTKVLPAALRVLIPVLVVTTTVLAKFTDVARVTSQVITAVLRPVIAAIVPVVNAMATAFTSAWNKVSSAVRAAVAVVMPLINGIVAIVRGMVNAVVGVLTGDWARAWAGIKAVVTTVIDGVKAYLAAVPGAMLSLGVAIGQAIIRGIVSGFTGLLGQLKSSLESGLRSVVSSLNPFSPVEEGGAMHIGRPLAQGAIRGWIEGSAALPTTMAQKIRDAVASARTAIQQSESVLSSAMEGLANAMMAAFDKVTSEHMTKTEKQLLARQEALAEKQRQQALTDAQDALAQAQSQLSAATTPEEIDAANQAIAAAYEQQQDALYNIETAKLEARAQQERLAYDAKKERQRVALQNELTAAENAYNRGAITLEQYNNRVMAIMKKYEIPWKKSAAALGAQLAAGLHGAFADVQAAARALAQTIVKELSSIKVIVQVNLSEGKGNRTIPGRAIGGPVRKGMPYVVGEVGPELFIPNASGYIQPNAASGSGVGGGIVNVFELNFNGPTVGTSREFEDTVRRALYDVQRRNPGTGLATT